MSTKRFERNNYELEFKKDHFVILDVEAVFSAHDDNDDFEIGDVTFNFEVLDYFVDEKSLDTSLLSKDDLKTIEQKLEFDFDEFKYKEIDDYYEED
jgi:hypothetical protein